MLLYYCWKQVFALIKPVFHSVIPKNIVPFLQAEIFFYPLQCFEISSFYNSIIFALISKTIGSPDPSDLRCKYSFFESIS